MAIVQPVTTMPVFIPVSHSSGGESDIYAVLAILLSIFIFSLLTWLCGKAFANRDGDEYALAGLARFAGKMGAFAAFMLIAVALMAMAIYNIIN